MSEYEVKDVRKEKIGVILEILTPWGETKNLLVQKHHLTSKAELQAYLKEKATAWKADKDLENSVTAMNLVGEKFTEKAKP